MTKQIQFRILLLTFLLISTSVFCQKTLMIKEATSKASIPFAKVFPNVGDPFLTDIDGRFTVSPSVTSVKIRASQFFDSTFVLSELSDNNLYLQAQFQEIQEVLVLPGENPAHRIINKVIDNRKLNNPMKNQSFQYQGYSKFISQVDPNSLSTIPDTTSDSTLIDIRKISQKQHLFLIEQSSIRTFFPPLYDREEVTAYKVSGFKDPLFTILSKQMQSFSFYNNSFDLMGKSYVNPIAPGGTNRYLFILEDTTFVGVDTVFNISFRPRKGKRFDGMKGNLYINTSGYAIEKVLAEPNEGIATLSLKIIQEYAQLSPEKWFPSKLSSEILFPDFMGTDSTANLDLLMKSSSYIDSVQLDPIRKRWTGLNNENIVILDDAESKTDEEWAEIRRFKITEKEQNTYEVVDSLSKAENFEKYLYALKVISTGKIPLGYFVANLKEIFNYNGYEGIRLGVGLETSKKLIKPITLGGYFAYGFSDKAWKYGGKLDIHIYPKKSLKLSLNYKDDVFERGGKTYPDMGFSLIQPQGFRNISINSMDRMRQASANLSMYVRANVKFSIFGSYNRLGFQDNYQYAQAVDQPLINQMDVGLTGVEIYWRIREKVQIIGDQRLALSLTKFPVVFARLEHSIPGFYESKSRFARLYTEVSQNITLRGFGSFTYVLSAGKTIGSSPLTFAQTPLNSRYGGKLLLSIPHTFETMLSSQYYLSEQASLFTKLNFLPFGKIGEASEPQLSLHHAVGFGSKISEGNHVLPDTFKGMEKGYFEAGISLNNVYISSFSGFGLGVFYQYGPGSEANIAKNLVLKLTVNPAF